MLSEKRIAELRKEAEYQGSGAMMIEGSDLLELLNQLEFVTKQNAYLNERDDILTALESGGVDNWTWYEESLKNAGLR